MSGPLADAWANVHANAPDGWFGGLPGYDERYTRWSQFAFDMYEPAVNGGRERQWMTVGQTELDCVWSMAYCLGC